MASACVSPPPRAFWTALMSMRRMPERMIMRARVAAGWGFPKTTLPVEEVPAEEAAPVEEMRRGRA